MYLSHTDEAAIPSLTPSQKTEILYHFAPDDGGKADVAILLGGEVCVWEERLAAAVAFYRAGRADKILVTGGVLRDLPEGGRKIEATALADHLVSAGIPRDAILVETEARTTQENMIYAALQIYRHLTWERIRRITVITSLSHMKRSLALAREFLPSLVSLNGFPTSRPEELPDACYTHPFYGMRTDIEISLLRHLIVTGQIPDIRYHGGDTNEATDTV